MALGVQRLRQHSYGRELRVSPQEAFNMAGVFTEHPAQAMGFLGPPTLLGCSRACSSWTASAFRKAFLALPWNASRALAACALGCSFSMLFMSIAPSLLFFFVK